MEFGFHPTFCRTDVSAALEERSKDFFHTASQNNRVNLSFFSEQLVF